MVSNTTGITDEIKSDITGGVRDSGRTGAKASSPDVQIRPSTMAEARPGAIERHKAIVAAIASVRIDHKDTGVGMVPLRAEFAIAEICATDPESDDPMTTSSGGLLEWLALRSVSRGSAGRGNRDSKTKPPLD